MSIVEISYVQKVDLPLVNAASGSMPISVLLDADINFSFIGDSSTIPTRTTAAIAITAKYIFLFLICV